MHIDWIDIYANCTKMQCEILDRYGKLSEEQWNSAMPIVHKYWPTWDRLSTCSNGDRQYAPIVFVWYAKNILKIKTTIPLKVMRAIFNQHNKGYETYTLSKSER